MNVMKYQIQLTCVKTEEGSSSNKLSPEDLKKATIDLIARLNNSNSDK